jgi:hypothetical protein
MMNLTVGGVTYAAYSEAELVALAAPTHRRVTRAPVRPR